MGKGILICGDREEKLVSKVAQQPCHDVPVALGKEIRVPPRCQMILPLNLIGQVDDEQLLLIESVDNPYDEVGVFRGRAVCHSQQGRVYMPIINTLLSPRLQ